jgi:hypothetical protein
MQTMKKIIIPRKDHEVYFISAPNDLKRKLIRQFVYEQLQKLHPAFSEASVFDCQYLVFNNLQWIMVTVMDRETFEEYRILNKRAAFFTNTAIAVRKKDFTNSGINTIDDEQIGFDSENNKPVSLPLETERNCDKPEQEETLKSIQPWFGLFTENEQRRGITTLSIGILAIMFLSLIFALAAKSNKEPVCLDMPVEPIAEIKYLPSAIEILENFSCDIVEAKGIMTHWKYTGDIDPFNIEPFIEIQMQGMDVIKIYEICNRYDFLSLQDIQDIKYNEGKPFVTIQLNQAGKGYTLHNASAFSSQSSTIQLIDGISNSLRQQKVSISSEILPAGHNGKNSYTITYTAKDKNLISSLDIIVASCNEFSLSIKSLDVSIANDGSLFTINVSLSQSDEADNALYSLGNEKSKIPIAFGYREEVIKIVSPEKRVAEEKTIEAMPGKSLVGSIKDASGQMVFYHDASTKKIVVGGSYD